MKEVPLFILNGFLDSGKTTIIKEIIENNPDYQDNSTVIIACEQGEIEYDEKWCDKYQVHVEYIEDQDEFTPEFMRNIDNIYRANQYVIEYNSFFDFEKQDFPSYMVIYQQITMIDAQTFKVMFNNMRKIFQSMLNPKRPLGLGYNIVRLRCFRDSGGAHKFQGRIYFTAQIAT